MLKRLGICAFGCSLGLGASPLLADESNAKSVTPLGSVFGSTGIVFPEGKSRIVLKSMFFSKDDFYNGSDETDDPKSLNAAREADVMQHRLVMRHGFGAGWDARVIVPYVSKTQEQTHPDGDRHEWSNDGLGDVELLIRREILNQKKGDPLFLALGAGLKFPTGDTDERFTKYYPEAQGGAQESYMPYGLQNGTGSLDPMLEIGLTKMLPSSRIDAHMKYRITNEGDEGVERGNHLAYTLAYSYGVHPRFDLEAGLHGHLRDKDKVNGVARENTGGHILYAYPAIHAKISPQFDLSVGYALPILIDVNGDSGGTGTSSYPEGQGVEDSRLMVRLGYNF